MGSVVTVGMFIGLVYTILLKSAHSVRKLPVFIHMAIGGLVFLGGAWNVFWHAIRHLTQFWGLAALVSGVALMLTGVYIAKRDSAPPILIRSLPAILLILFGCMMLYGITIYRL